MLAARARRPDGFRQSPVARRASVVDARVRIDGSRVVRSRRPFASSPRGVAVGVTDRRSSGVARRRDVALRRVARTDGAETRRAIDDVVRRAIGDDAHGFARVDHCGRRSARGIDSIAPHTTSLLTRRRRARSNARVAPSDDDARDGGGERRRASREGGIDRARDLKVDLAKTRRERAGARARMTQGMGVSTSDPSSLPPLVEAKKGTTAGWLGRGRAREDASGTRDDDDGTKGEAKAKEAREGRYERVNPMNYASVNDTTKLLVCGGIAGAFSKSCTAPLARLTILNQLQGTNAVPGWEAAAGRASIVSSLRRIVATEGVTALWKGNGVTIIHRLPYSAVNFYAYEQIMNVLDEVMTTLHFDENGDPAVGAFKWGFAQRLLAGGSAGCIACTLTYPLDLIRTRLAAQTTVKHYNGIADAFMKILRDEGTKGLYRGLKPTLIGVGPNLALNFAAYETLRNHLQSLDHGMYPMAVDLASGSAAAVVSATATFPIDLVRRRMQMRDAVRGDSFVGVFKRVLAKEGVTGLYRGILPEFAKVAPGVAITYTSYAFLKRLAGVDTGRL